MTDITLNVEQFTAGIKDAVSRTLAWVELKPPKAPLDEITPPDDVEEAPSVMAEFFLVPSTDFRFEYKKIRSAKLSYLLERDGSYCAGVFTFFHDLAVDLTTPDNENTQPPIPDSFIPPNFFFHRTTEGGNLGVEFSIMHDDTTSGSEEKYGLAFKITDADPPKFPKLVASYLSAFSQETI